MSRLDLTLVTLAVLYPACLPDPDFGTDSATGSGSGTASTGDASASTTGGVDSSTGASTPTTSGSGSGTTSTGPDATTTTGSDTSTSTSGGFLTPTCSGLLGDGKPWGRCPCDPGFECRVTDGGSVCVAACDAPPCEFPGCLHGTCSASQCVWPCGSDADCLIDGTSCDLAASPPICTYA